MCGIAGLIVKPAGLESAGDLPERIHRMLDAMRHRGPDDWGTHCFVPDTTQSCFPARDLATPSTDGFCMLGHRRLAIIDLSTAGRQPFTLQDAGLTITYNGEIYNYLELRSELEKRFTFETRTDTEVLLRAYQAWELDVFERLDGMFAFVIRDAVHRRFVCARDHLGIKPFYYSNSPDAWIFGSEPAVVLTGLNSRGHIDPVHAAEFLYLGLTDHDGGTFFREVSQLEPGSYRVIPFEDGRITGGKYWRAVFSECSEPGDAGLDYSGEFRDRLLISVQRQLRADVPTGSCLSGGLDSGSIVSAASHVLGQAASDYACLTVVSPGTPWDESKLAESTATRFGCRWIRVEPSPGDMALELESMARFMGEPFNGLSVFAQYKVMEQARQNGLKVMLDGQGGDELFTGYPRMAQILILDRIKSLKWFRAWNDLRALRKHACQPVSRSLMSMIYFQTPRIAWRRNRCRMAPFVDPELADHVRWETVQTLYGPVSFAARQTQEFGMSCLPRLLRYEDRNSMAFSVEARVPILGREVVDLALKLPAEWKVRHGWTKYIIRCNMDGILPDDVVWNSRKQGFDVPEALWMSILSEAIVRWLEECRDVPVNCHAVRSALRNGGAMNQWFWRLVSFVLWARVTGVGI